MSNVVIDMTMSLDGFVAGPEDGKDHPLGTHDGMRLISPRAVPARAGGEPRSGEVF
jgi:hypothetical protein